MMCEQLNGSPIKILYRLLCVVCAAPVFSTAFYYQRVQLPLTMSVLGIFWTSRSLVNWH